MCGSELESLEIGDSALRVDGFDNEPWTLVRRKCSTERFNQTEWVLSLGDAFEVETEEKKEVLWQSEFCAPDVVGDDRGDNRYLECEYGLCCLCGDRVAHERATCPYFIDKIEG